MKKVCFMGPQPVSDPVSFPKDYIVDWEQGPNSTRVSVAVLTATNIYPTPCLGHIYTKKVPTVDLKIKSDWASCILSGKFTLRKQTHSLPLTQMSAGDTWPLMIQKMSLNKFKSLPRDFCDYQGRGVGWGILCSPLTTGSFFVPDNSLLSSSNVKKTNKPMRGVDFTGELGVEGSSLIRHSFTNSSKQYLESFQPPTTNGFSWPSAMIPGSLPLLTHDLFPPLPSPHSPSSKEFFSYRANSQTKQF